MPSLLSRAVGALLVFLSLPILFAAGALMLRLWVTAKVLLPEPDAGVPALQQSTRTPGRFQPAANPSNAH